MKDKPLKKHQMSWRT